MLNVGDTGVINGVTYTVVDEAMLESNVGLMKRM